jgi:hypothetical protein
MVNYLSTIVDMRQTHAVYCYCTTNNNSEQEEGIKLKNLDIRKAVSDAGLRLWQVANKLGIRDNEFSRALRFELSDEEKNRIRTIIQVLQDEEEQRGTNETN